MAGGTRSIRFAHLALPAILLVTPSLSAFAGGVAILNTVLSDNGDDDGFGDTKETVSMRLTVRNTSGIDLTGVTAQLIADDGDLACLTNPTIDIGDLVAGEEKLTDEAFVFTVADVDRTASGLDALDDLSVTFDVTITSQPEDQQAYPSQITVDLDLQVGGGSGITTFIESFEETLGAFEIENLDQGIDTTAESDGYRCQYNDPDWINSAGYGSDPGRYQYCHLGVSALHADAVFWGLSGPNFSPLGGRGFSGSHSLFFGIDLGPDKNWTTPLAMLEAVKTSEPINLGWDDVSPSLSIMHQVSLVDGRALNMPLGRSSDRGVVMAQLADEQDDPVSDWIKLYPYDNVYDTQAYDGYYLCMFDPVDDGNTEDDFFDPTDPDRRLGPSSTCFPEYAYSHIGETSNPFAAGNVGSADGPGQQGEAGIGTWIESKFDLSRFRGKRVRLRFLATAIEFNDEVEFENWEDIAGWNPTGVDDGWWIDDVTVSDALTAAADVTVDDQDNSSLPDPPGGDTDSDGIFDVCDNCAVGVNPDQSDVDLDGLGDLCDPCPVHPFVEDHDLDGLCAEQDNCPFDANPGQANGDGDPAGTACDCDDTNPWTYPGAEEVNDGVDNQCPGDAGYGVADETSSQSGFYNPNNKNEYSWPVQPWVNWYEVVRGNTADFSVGCTMFGPFLGTHLRDVELMASGEMRYYMNRSFQPNLGSWGQDSSGLERDVPCD